MFVQMRGRVAIVSLAVLFAGCIAPQTTVMRDIPPHGWCEPVTLVIDNDDTLSLRRLSFVVRYNTAFRDDVVRADINVIQPDAASFSEMVDIRFAHPYSPSAVSATETIVYREASVLRQRGNYLFTITPLHPVHGVEAIGLNIEKQ